jgi:hypothetical protein
MRVSAGDEPHGDFLFPRCATLPVAAVAVKKWAERKIGELMDEKRKAGKLAKPPNPKRRVAKKPDDPPTLAAQGVDKNPADR